MPCPPAYPCPHRQAELRAREEQLAQARAWLDEAQDELLTTQGALAEREAECRRVTAQLEALRAVATDAQVLRLAGRRWRANGCTGAGGWLMGCTGIGQSSPVFRSCCTHQQPASLPPHRHHVCAQEAACSLEGRDADLLQQNLALAAQLATVTAAYEEARAAAAGAGSALAAFGTTASRPVRLLCPGRRRWEGMLWGCFSALHLWATTEESTTPAGHYADRPPPPHLARPHVRAGLGGVHGAGHARRPDARGGVLPGAHARHARAAGRPPGALAGRVRAGERAVGAGTAAAPRACGAAPPVSAAPGLMDGPSDRHPPVHPPPPPPVTR